ncbi:hypothetical protein FB451DRAFT_681141 [Mycena latifolia]|nr:hypothetical protein FB451DRAFT_681141 [Mycena latifolia]
MESSEDSSPFFPLELERDILETAAYLYPETIPNLLLVALSASMNERIKYRTVTSDGIAHTCRIHVLQQAICSTVKPANFFRDRVWNLFVEKNMDEDKLVEILSMCSALRSLVVFPYPERSILPRLQTMKLRRLALFLKGLFEDRLRLDPADPMFTSLTHLDLFDSLDSSSDLLSLFANLALLPALTHLALFELNDSTVGTQLLSTKGKLKVLVRMQSLVPYPAEVLPSIDDARFVSLLVSDEEYPSDWIFGTRGRLDFWARAELFVAKKRRGEIKPNSRCWIEEGDGI